MPVTADNAQKLSQKRSSSCSVVIVDNYPTVVASGWKQKIQQFTGALVSLTPLLKGFHSCSTSGGYWLSLGRESDGDSRLLERSLFQMYIKIRAFDDTKHLPGLGSCTEPRVSQEGAEVSVPSVPACVDSAVP